jgi:hypothetical protein
MSFSKSATTICASAISGICGFYYLKERNLIKADKNVDEIIFHQIADKKGAEIIKPNELSKQQMQQEKLKISIANSKNLCWTKMYEAGIPGLVIAVSVDGKTVWTSGNYYVFKSLLFLNNKT